MKDRYDYIIAGAGCAGLSLLRRMMQHEFFHTKNILLIDKQQKNANDKTWCFWEQQPGVFEDIVYHSWKQIDFFADEFSARYDLAPYTYKMIRGIDLYNTVLSEAKTRSNIDIITAEVLSLLSNETYAAAKTADNEFHANYIFNSIIFNDWTEALQQKNAYVLLQHFKGWLIKTTENIFDERIATFMDFRVSQERGTTFIYLMPLSSTEALIEYTLFTEELLNQHEYDVELSKYVQNFLNIKNYTVTHTEFGIIPMTSYRFSMGDGRIVNIGTAGGQIKGSSGYAFQFIQKHSTDIIKMLASGTSPLTKHSTFHKRFRLYDRIFLNVLHNKKMSGAKLFAMLFRKNSPQQVLKFLDNETTFAEDLKIMNTVPLNKFLPAALHEIVRW